MVQIHELPGGVRFEADETLQIIDADGEVLDELDGAETDELVEWLAEDVRGRTYKQP